MMKLYNSLSRQIETVQPLQDPELSIYSCGPTVYDRVHIGNLSAFIAADTLRRIAEVSGYQVRHVMNITDVDDKTIARSKKEYTELDAHAALTQTTAYYTEHFMRDMRAIGNDTDSLEFIAATAPATMHAIEALIVELYANDIAYLTNDGVYFSLTNYQKAGKTYGQLTSLTAERVGVERIDNDDYDKDSPHDFALWKFAKDGEPSWTITIDGRELRGRPGWHIECSAMSRLMLGQPFDIHTGGIDLKFPHHENEIAQSTACADSPMLAKLFVHNEHVLVDDRKMSKSLGNFYTLKDLLEHGVEPLAFRLLVLQSHYRSATNFSFTTLDAATARLRNWQNYASLRHQTHPAAPPDDSKVHRLLVATQALVERLAHDIDTPSALSWIDEVFSSLDTVPLERIDRSSLVAFIELIDRTLGLQLLDTTPDITDETKRLILERERAREQKDWDKSDQLRQQIASTAHIELRDTPSGTVWRYAHTTTK